MMHKFLRLAAILAAALGFPVNPASAAYVFEDAMAVADQRLVLIVGFANDIPWAGEATTLMVAPYLFPADAPDDWDQARFVNMADNDPGNPNTFPDDYVNLRGTAELLDAQGRVLKRAALPERFTQPTSGDYQSRFIPGEPGRYAFVLSGRVNEFRLDKVRFVCKPRWQVHGWQGDGFPCVLERKQPLPFAPLAP